MHRISHTHSAGPVDPAQPQYRKPTSVRLAETHGPDVLSLASIRRFVAGGTETSKFLPHGSLRAIHKPGTGAADHRVRCSLGLA